MKTAKKKVTTNYIDAEEFKSEMLKSQQDNKCTERLGELLIILHDHILTMPRFVKYDKQLKDEMKSYSIFRILKRGIITFDPTSTARRCFNYYTTAGITNMTQCAQRFFEHKERYQEFCDDVYQDFRSRQNYQIV